MVLEVDNFGDLTDEVASNHIGLLKAGIEDGMRKRIIKAMSNEFSNDGSPK